jgi:hypothetical protein
MPHAVGHLHSRLRHRTGDRPASAIAARFARLPKDALADALERTLDEALDNKSVIVLRELRTHAVFPVHGDDAMPSDAELLAHWSRTVGQAIARAVGRREGENLIRFPSRAAFVAAFLHELQAGRAWDRWWCGDFARWRRATLGETITACLDEHGDDVGAILAALGVSAGGELLARLDPAGRERVWRAALAAAGSADIAAADAAPAQAPLSAPPGALGPDQLAGLLPIIDAARSLADRLGLRLGDEPDQRSAQRLAERLGGPVDWRDPADLACAVAAALAVLVAGTRPGDQDAKPPEHAAIGAAVAPLSWLDRPALEVALQRMLAGAVSAPPPTPRLQRLLAEIAAALAAGSLPTHDAAGTALGLWSRLVARSAPLGEEPIVRLWLDRLVRLAAAIRVACPADGACATLRLGDTAAVRRQLAAAVPAWLATFDHLASAGGPAFQVLAALAEQSFPIAAFPVVSTPAAGVLLLCRTLDDARFDAGCREARLDAPESRLALRLALGRAIAGLGRDTNAWADPALRVFAGLSLDASSPDPAALPAPAFIAAVSRAVARTAFLRRAWRPERLAATSFGPWTVLADPAGLAWLAVDAGSDTAAIAREFDASLATEEPSGGSWASASAALGLAPDEAVDLVLGGLAALVLRVFAAWLRGCAGSSIGWLVSELLRRPGRLALRPGMIEVELEPRPYDVLLRQAGFLEPYTAADGRGPRLSFTLREVAG